MSSDSFPPPNGPPIKATTVLIVTVWEHGYPTGLVQYLSTKYGLVVNPMRLP